MKQFSQEKLRQLQENTSNIRNICIMAHVDHGKTTLADSLVASNGIISQKLVGKLRYMDSRKDEQERGITMKSSSISLLHQNNNQEYLINLIDSPGHVDFSSEVSTAVRLCDGAVIVVDVVEGVCAQTKVVLRQAWLEHIKPVLLLNKIDRLIVEMKLQPLDVFVRMSQILEQVNAQVGELFAMDVMSKKEMTSANDASQDRSSGLEDSDDSNLYFAPERGNVVFACAADGWGFTIPDMARILAPQTGLSEAALQASLWGDFYLDSAPKKKKANSGDPNDGGPKFRIVTGAQEKAKSPLFVQLVLNSLWNIYESFLRKDQPKMDKILDKIQVKVSPRDLKHSDARVAIQALLSQWLSLSDAVLKMVCEKLPSPLEMSEARAEKLLTWGPSSRSLGDLPAAARELKKAFVACRSDDQQPVVAFISKMVLVDRQCLPQNKPRPLSAQDIAQRREMVRQRHAELMLKQQQEETTTTPPDQNNHHVAAETKPPPEPEPEQAKEVFIAFARVFSGTLRKGQQLYVLGPKYDPTGRSSDQVDENLLLKDLKDGQHVTRATVGDLYVLMGREMESLDSVPAGNVVGIGGLEEHVLKSATLSSTLDCPAFCEMTQMAVPIVRVAVEPARPTEMNALLQGLKLLNQADPCVQVVIQETGEHVLITAGEIHLQRCLQDLRESYAKIEINASQPIVPFRETLVHPLSEDVTSSSSDQQALEQAGHVVVQTTNKNFSVRLQAVSLPEEVTALLDRNVDLIKSMRGHQSQPNRSLDQTLADLKLEESLSGQMKAKVVQLQQELTSAFQQAGPQWQGLVDRILCFGPRHIGPNILVNRSSLSMPNLWGGHSTADQDQEASTLGHSYLRSFINGFDLATQAGPLCEEPLMGVCFIIEECTVLPAESGGEGGAQPSETFVGQVLSVFKKGCRMAFQSRPQRLMAAMYNCAIQVNGQVLGKIYGVLARRHGRILDGDLLEEGSASFGVTAVLPVVESFDLANEIRKQTSGEASHQLTFSHWEVIETDPFWTPTTEEERELYGDKGDSVNRAQLYMNAVRRRKGLPVLEKVVEFAEKQRTLSRKV